MRTEKYFGGNNLCNENKLADMEDKLIWKHFGYNLKEIEKFTNEYIKSFIRKLTTNQECA